MAETASPGHVLDVLIFDENEAFEDEASFKVLDHPEDFLFVAKQGNPDFSQDPLAISLARVATYMRGDETFAAEPVKETMAEFMMAHTALVEPMQQFRQEGHEASELSHVEIGALLTIIEWYLAPGGTVENTHVAAAHVLYPSVSGGENASALLVTRQILHTNRVVGSVGDYNGRTGLDLDLVDLIDRERQGQATNLRVGHSVEARALGAVGLLADRKKLQASTDNYRGSRRARIKASDPSTRLRER